ncbi:type II toxin-antitoxin system VapC family toxin [Mucilaginibacter flavus]|uniref:type II toxin-antitoxin system VapC family toxin n=1 Tax=Mucilaginibacter flavus TaxID=931504 RepID=UPI0025B41B41|nr:type II toxin-antitoxin system VapC family toxin [Mucilaginibacter flavus]MDN3582601.1 type II toxin-antitoxin system VapC family toxin [Mucilaginibacter flavus]
MADEIILLDTSILIEHFRKKDQTKTTLFELTKAGYRFAVSTITEYEIYAGAFDNQIEFWNLFFQKMEVLAFDSKVAVTVSEIITALKKINKVIEAADLFIAATAVCYNTPCATLNKKHFERIEKLRLIS